MMPGAEDPGEGAVVARDGVQGEREDDGPHDRGGEAHEREHDQGQAPRPEEGQGEEDERRDGEPDKDLPAVEELEEDEAEDAAEGHQEPEQGDAPGADRLGIVAVVDLEELGDPERDPLLGPDVGEDAQEVEEDDLVLEELLVGRPGAGPLLLLLDDGREPDDGHHDDHGEEDDGEDPVDGDPMEVGRDELRHQADEGLGLAARPADVPDEIRVDERAEERGAAEDELGHDGVEGVMLLAPRDAEEGVDGDLEGGHARPDQEEREQEDRVAGSEGDEHGPGERQAERGDHDRLLPVFLEEHAGRDGHDAVGDEEGEGEKADERQAEAEALADVRIDGADDVGHERDDEEGQEDQGDHRIASFRGVGHRSLLRFRTVFPISIGHSRAQGKPAGTALTPHRRLIQ